MTENAGKSEVAARQERLRQQAEHRVIVQAAMQAKRTGKLQKSLEANPRSDALTAIVVLVVVVGMLVAMLRAGG